MKEIGRSMGEPVYKYNFLERFFNPFYRSLYLKEKEKNEALQHKCDMYSDEYVNLLFRYRKLLELYNSVKIV